jgi:hypothetical protein
MSTSDASKTKPLLVDVAVLNTLPLARADWTRRAARPPIGDLARFHAETRWGGNIEAAWDNFASRAAFVERKLAIFESRGIDVVRHAATSDVRRAGYSHADVVLLAHWKSTEPLASDTRDEPGQRLELWDSMVQAKDLVALFPEGFHGTLFLASCHSIVPVEVFRRARPRSMCICHRHPVDAGITMAKLDAALEYMRVDGIPLWRALLQVGEDIDGLA